MVTKYFSKHQLQGMILKENPCTVCQTLMSCVILPPLYLPLKFLLDNDTGSSKRLLQVQSGVIASECYLILAMTLKQQTLAF